MREGVVYATLDGRPVLLDDVEAWWLVSNQWLPLHHAEAFACAGLLTKETFERMFPDLPQLPEAFR